MERVTPLTNIYTPPIAISQGESILIASDVLSAYTSLRIPLIVSIVRLQTSLLKMSTNQRGIPSMTLTSIT